MGTVIELKDLQQPELDVYARLTQAQLRSRVEPEKGIFIAESPKVILRALEAGYAPVSLLMERQKLDGPAGALARRPEFDGLPVYTGPRELLAQLTGYTLTRGVLCAMRRPRLPDAAQLCAGARRIAVLEGIVDSTNTGAIFRSAAALNLDAVLLTPSCSDPLCRRAVRVSMGTVFQVPWTYLDGCRRWASARRLWPCGTTPCPSTTRPWRRSRSWPSYWAPRATAWPRPPSPPATTPSASPWPTASTP